MLDRCTTDEISEELNKARNVFGNYNYRALIYLLIQMVMPMNKPLNYWQVSK
jgi:hypothetical protein